MRKYELMVILSPEVDERNVAATLKKLFAVVPSEGGSIDDLDVWGKRRLAYPILKFTEGLYAVAQMTATSELAQELDRQLSLNESVLRTKLLRK